MITLPAPMHAPEGSRAPFTDPAWLFEIKMDGHRCMAGIEAGEVELRTKSGAICTSWYPEVCEVLSKLPGESHVIDGEATVLDKYGVTHFDRFQTRARRRRRYPGCEQVTLCAFDILVYNGKRVMDLPLVDRKALLSELLRDVPKQCVLCVSDLPADAGVFKAMVDSGLKIEGVMAKKKSSIYTPGVRSEDWRKIKREGWQGRKWRSA